MPVGFGNELELLWLVPKQSGEIPVKRSGHSFTLRSTDTETAIYMFGGCDHKSPPGPTNDLFKAEINNGYTWSKVIPSANGPEDLPPPRWRHSAVLHDKKIVIFGGFSAEKRMNDLWIFNTDLRVWEQKHPQGLWEGLPQCRGAHSATLVQDKMYIFGGYGGNGYGRADFNDLHALDLVTFRWEEIQTKGEKPESRSGHQTCLVKEQLFVIGGWNSFKQFQDIFAFDLPTKTWSALSVRLASPMWNHTCVGVPAVPHWKVFMFGGNSGDLAESGTAQGAYLNSVMALDTGIMEWVTPPEKGELPSPRADTTMVFDKNTNHLIFFGGWANRWFNDLHVLNASEIVGPPYAISSIEPKSGPITGNAKIKVHGYNFTGQPASLRFAVAKGYVDVMGTVLSPTIIQATAPSFEKYGSLLTEVRASLSGGMYTNASTSFKFHSVTSALKSLAFGPCLVSSLNDNTLAEFPTTFIIQARDKDDNPRDCGGDEFTILLKACDELGAVAASKAAGAAGATEAASEDEPITSIIDKNDGTYVVTFAAPKAGKFQLSVGFNGTFNGIAGPVRGSPFTIFFQQPTEENKAKCMPPLNSEKDMDSSDLIRRLMANMNKRNGEFRRILVEIAQRLVRGHGEAIPADARVVGGLCHAVLDLAAGALQPHGIHHGVSAGDVAQEVHAAQPDDGRDPRDDVPGPVPGDLLPGRRRVRARADSRRCPLEHAGRDLGAVPGGQLALDRVRRHAAGQQPEGAALVPAGHVRQGRADQAELGALGGRVPAPRPARVRVPGVPHALPRPHAHLPRDAADRLRRREVGAARRRDPLPGRQLTA